MSYHDLAYLFALAVGLTAAGFVASLWAILAHEEVEISLLLDPYPSIATPFRVFAVIVGAPLSLVYNAVWHLIDRPPLGLLMLVAGLAWAFFQGVFILTWIFGLS